MNLVLILVNSFFKASDDEDEDAKKKDVRQSKKDDVSSEVTASSDDEDFPKRPPKSPPVSNNNISARNESGTIAKSPRKQRSNRDVPETNGLVIPYEDMKNQVSRYQDRDNIDVSNIEAYLSGKSLQVSFVFFLLLLIIIIFLTSFFVKMLNFKRFLV